MTKKTKILIVTVFFASIYFVSAQTRIFGKFPSSQSSTGEKITVDGIGVKKTYSGFRGKEVEVSGSGNRIIVNGWAENVVVSGSDNSLYIDRVTRVTVSGTKNKVYYKSSPNPLGDAFFNISGLDNEVAKTK